jgi:Dipeptidyl peptidase IV (DPP IV) N-terminal region
MEAALAKLPGMTVAEAKRLAAGRFEMNPTRTGALINYANDLFYYQFGSESALRLTNTAEVEVGEEFSPDGRMVGFVRNYNIHLVDIAMQRERSLTRDGN